MVPKYLFDVKNDRSHVALEALHDATVLCVSAIGSADAFVENIEMVSCLVTVVMYVTKIQFLYMLTNGLDRLEHVLLIDLISVIIIYLKHRYNAIKLPKSGLYHYLNQIGSNQDHIDKCRMLKP